MVACMAKWGTNNDDLAALDLRIIIERLRGIYRNIEGPVSYQSSRIELEAARRLELTANLLLGTITTDLILEVTEAAYEKAREDLGEGSCLSIAWHEAPEVMKEAWVAGIGVGLVKFLSSIQEGGGADGIMGKQNREELGHEKGSEATGGMPAQPLTGL